MDVVPDIYFGSLERDVLLLASDGLTGMLEDDSSPILWGRRGTPGVGRSNGGSQTGGVDLDNITAIVLGSIRWKATRVSIRSCLPRSARAPESQAAGLERFA